MSTWRVAQAVGDILAQRVPAEAGEGRLARKRLQRRLARGEAPPPPQRQHLHARRGAPAAERMRLENEMLDWHSRCVNCQVYLT